MLHFKSCNLHMVEVLLQEMDRPPGPDMAHALCRESYALSAGLALGMVAFREGSRLQNVSALNVRVVDRLHHYISGGKRKPFVGPNAEKYASLTNSFLIKEGDEINKNVTAPGAMLALGMMFFKSNNKEVASWLTLPESERGLENIVPQHLLLRVLTRCLVMWDDIEPSTLWITYQVPASVAWMYLRIRDPAVWDSVRERDMDEAMADLRLGDLEFEDWETVVLTYGYCVAGACMAVGLKYAGSNSLPVHRVLYRFVTHFELLVESFQPPEAMNSKGFLEIVLQVLLLADAMVMAGSGSLEVMRTCRHLRLRFACQDYHYVEYGSHMATAMSLGLNFLGGGRYSLRTDDQAIAAMLCAFYPKFPYTTTDNQYHLQAFRHLYVLATEARLLMPREIGTEKLVPVMLEVQLMGGDSEPFLVDTPCLLPELNKVASVRIVEPRYWPQIFTQGKNMKCLHDFLKNGGGMLVKRFRRGAYINKEGRTQSKSKSEKVYNSQGMTWFVPLSKFQLETQPGNKRLNFYLQKVCRINDTQPLSCREMTNSESMVRALYDTELRDLEAVGHGAVMQARSCLAEESECLDRTCSAAYLPASLARSSWARLLDPSYRDWLVELHRFPPEYKNDGASWCKDIQKNASQYRDVARKRELLRVDGILFPGSSMVRADKDCLVGETWQQSDTPGGLLSRRADHVTADYVERYNTLTDLEDTVDHSGIDWSDVDCNVFYVDVNCAPFC